MINRSKLILASFARADNAWYYEGKHWTFAIPHAPCSF